MKTFMKNLPDCVLPILAFQLIKNVMGNCLMFKNACLFNTHCLTCLLLIKNKTRIRLSEGTDSALERYDIRVDDFINKDFYKLEFAKF